MQVLTDAQWAKFEAAIAAIGLRGARPRKDERRTIEAIVWRLDNGAKWRSIPAELGEEFPLASLIGTLGMAKSNSAARDLIKQGGVSLDGDKVGDPMVKLRREDAAGKTLRVGKHQFARLA